MIKKNEKKRKGRKKQAYFIISVESFFNEINTTNKVISSWINCHSIGGKEKKKKERKKIWLFNYFVVQMKMLIELVGDHYVVDNDQIVDMHHHDYLKLFARIISLIEHFFLPR
jgi:hypothetical protein